MEPNQIAAFKLIEQAQQAMKKGEYIAARQFAAQASQSAPELEEVWLIMAALAAPQASVAYLQRALEINPQSERAQKGMLWAQNRLQQELEKQAATARQAAADAPTMAPVVEEPVPAAPEQIVSASEEEEPVEVALQHAISAPLEESIEEVSESPGAAPEVEKPGAVALAPRAVLEPKTAPVNKPAEAPKPAMVTKTVQSEKTVTRRRYSNLALPLLVIIICLVLPLVILIGVKPAAAFFNSNMFNGREHGPAWAEVNVIKPTPSQAVPEIVIVPTTPPLAAPVPEILALPTATNTPLPTELPVPTNTPIPTEIAPTLTAILLPTETPLPTDLPLPTATVELASVEGPSPTPLPTDTAVPAPTPYVAPTARANNSSGSNTTAASSDGRWIDVDLTHQMVYAFEGNTVVNSFLVSTGTWQHPTVTGQFRVYIKYRSTTMSGPGYSLPNVPYAMYFYKSYGIHGTYWHNNFGTPMSHGCVNLTIPDAEWLYNWAPMGTLVNVHY